MCYVNTCAEFSMGHYLNLDAYRMVWHVSSTLEVYLRTPCIRAGRTFLITNRLSTCDAIMHFFNESKFRINILYKCELKSLQLSLHLVYQVQSICSRAPWGLVRKK